MSEPMPTYTAKSFFGTCFWVEDFGGQRVCDCATMKDAEKLAGLLNERAKRDLMAESDTLELIDERDAHEERLNRIFEALGMPEEDSTWSNVNDPAEKAIEHIDRMKDEIKNRYDAGKGARTCSTKSSRNWWTTSATPSSRGSAGSSSSRMSGCSNS